MKLDIVRKAIDLLENLNPKDSYAYERAVSAYFMLIDMPVLIAENLEILKTFRSRTHDNLAYFLKISDIALPPVDCIKQYARCNIPFQSVFYSSENRPTSYREFIEYWVNTKSIGDTFYVTIGEWIIKKPLDLIIITTPDTENRILDYDKKYGEVLDCFLLNFQGEELESLIIFYRFLFEKFRKKAKNDLKTYIITSAYCNVALMRQNGKAHGILYPSVPFEITPVSNSQEYNVGVNLALSKEFIKDENIELKSALRNEIKIVLNNQNKYSFIDNGAIFTKEIFKDKNFLLWDI